MAIQWDSVESSNIEAVGYDMAELSALYIRFKSGTVYKYDNVPGDIYEGLMDADSKGQYFAKHIKGLYQYQKIE